MVFDEPISLTCFKCGNYKSVCCNQNCEKPICKNCDAYYNPKKYYIYCMKCKNLACTKCFNMLHKCDKCNVLHCIDCDDGDVDLYDIFYCHQHRDIKVDELYSYFCEKYNELLSFEDIRKIILKIE